MENVEKKVLTNFSYTEMEKNKNEVLLQQLKEKDEKCGKKTSQLNEVTKSYNDFINTTCDFSDRIHKITSANLVVHDMQNHTLLDIQAIASDLIHRTFESTEKLKAIGTKHQSKSVFTEDEHYTGCSVSEAELSTHSDLDL